MTSGTSSRGPVVCQEPRELGNEFSGNESGGAAAPANTLTAAGRDTESEDPVKVVPRSLPAETDVVDVCCFQPLNFGVICYAALEN